MSSEPDISALRAQLLPIDDPTVLELWWMWLDRWGLGADAATAASLGLLALSLGGLWAFLWWARRQYLATAGHRQMRRAYHAQKQSLEQGGSPVRVVQALWKELDASRRGQLQSSVAPADIQLLYEPPATTPQGLQDQGRRALAVLQATAAALGARTGAARPWSLPWF